MKLVDKNQPFKYLYSEQSLLLFQSRNLKSHSVYKWYCVIIYCSETRGFCLKFFEFKKSLFLPIKNLQFSKQTLKTLKIYIEFAALIYWTIPWPLLLLQPHLRKKISGPVLNNKFIMISSGKVFEQTASISIVYA